VWRGAAQVQLTAREFLLLAFPLRHQGDVVSKRQILEAVLDVAFEGDPNIVEVHIRHLTELVASAGPDGEPVPWRVYADPDGHPVCLVVR
jgi:DNA-binding response OmpR family regulator